MVKFLILELGGGVRRFALLAGRCWMVDGRWRGFGGGPILFKLRRFWETGFFMQFLILELGVQELQGAVDLGAEAGLVAVEALEGAGIVYQMLVSDGGAGLCVADLELFADLGFLASDLVIHEGGLEGQDAVVAPAGGDQLIDEVEPGAGLGLVLGQVFFAQSVELLLGFAFEEELAGGESMGERGGTGAGDTLGGDGSAGPGAVGAGGINAFLGRHGAPSGGCPGAGISGVPEWRVARVGVRDEGLFFGSY